MSTRVLVADGDTARAAVIEQACIQRGFATRVVHHGAAALEAALSELPDVVVCQIALPLIDASRLRGILRANPHTRDVKLVYLGDQAADAATQGLGGPIVMPPIDPVQVATRIEAGVGAPPEDRQPRDRESGSSGQLTELPLAEVLQLFHARRKTGTVEVVRGLGRTRRQVGRVMLRAGDVVEASIGDAHGKKALFRLLAWNRGNFSFRPGPVETLLGIETPTRALLSEGLRQVREWERIAADLPALTANVSVREPPDALPDQLHPLTQAVLSHVEHETRVEDVIDACTAPDFQVLRTLQTLIQQGTLQISPEPGTLDLAPNVPSFDAEHATRLREWLELECPGALPQRDAKVVVVSARSESVRDFAALLARLPDAELSGRLEAESPAFEDLVLLGRVRIDSDVGVEFVHVPTDGAFAPIWPLAGHGALATLVVLAGPLGPAVESVRAASRTLAMDPSARIFYLMLLGKGERPAPEEIQQHLASADAGSLFLIPMHRADKTDLMLREMLERILP